jgi:hypothetical protein
MPRCRTRPGPSAALESAAAVLLRPPSPCITQSTVTIVMVVSFMVAAPSCWVLSSRSIRQDRSADLIGRTSRLQARAQGQKSVPRFLRRRARRIPPPTPRSKHSGDSLRQRADDEPSAPTEALPSPAPAAARASRRSPAWQRSLSAHRSRGCGLYAPSAQA